MLERGPIRLTFGADAEPETGQGEGAQIAALEAELGELQAELGRVAALKQRLDKALAELESERRELKQSRACPDPPCLIFLPMFLAVLFLPQQDNSSTVFLAHWERSNKIA